MHTSIGLARSARERSLLFGCSPCRFAPVGTSWPPAISPAISFVLNRGPENREGKPSSPVPGSRPVLGLRPSFVRLPTLTQTRASNIFVSDECEHKRFGRSNPTMIGGAVAVGCCCCCCCCFGYCTPVMVCSHGL